VFFDAGNTLLRMDYPAVAAELARHGVRVTAGDVQHAEWRARVRLDEEVLARLGADGSTESLSTAARYIQFVLEGLDIRDEAVHRALADWRQIYNRPVGLWCTAEPGADVALTRLRAAGLGVGVISNSNGSVRTALDAAGLARHLDFVLDSSLVGVEKPDPRIFTLALGEAGLVAGEAVYVGDLYSIDVRGARQAGLEAILLDPGGFWGARDCSAAPDVPAAADLVLRRLDAPA
jgi:putative hydrolase of the HAD superfamily